MRARTAATILIVVAAQSAAQTSRNPSAAVTVRQQGWEPVGSKTIQLDLAGPAGGEVVEVFFSPEGGRLYAITSRGAVWSTEDVGETWRRLPARPDAVRADRPEAAGETGPPREPGAVIYQHPFDSRYRFALGRDLYRSTDQGQGWVNLTADAAGSVIGPRQKAIAFSSLDRELIVVANSRGVWRSADLGLSWSDLNRNLPNLPEARLLDRGRGPENGESKIFLGGIGVAESGPVDWQPARDSRVADWARAVSELPVADQRRASPWPLAHPAGWALSYRVWRSGSVSPDLTDCGAGACVEPERRYISAFAGGGEAQPHFYAGTSDGRLWVSPDGGRTWRPSTVGFPASVPVTDLFVDEKDSRVAVAVVGGRGTGHVFRTTNAGLFWDDLSANLPDAPAYAVAANRETGSIYVGSEAGVFHTRADLRFPGPISQWTRLGGNLPEAPVEDLSLDPLNGDLYVAAAGHGVYRSTVPDILDALRVLNAADRSSRAAAPGGLLTVIGPPVRTVRAGGFLAPVLASDQTESQIQVPFEASGDRLLLALETRRGSARLDIPLEAVSPAIFIDSSGNPLILDGAGGVLLDSSRPAAAGSQLLVLATGLGRVRPEWPTGLAAPFENPPSTVTPVAAYLDGAPLRVLSSTLAGGYIGTYVVRIELPAIVNSGTAELVLNCVGKSSNPVRIFLEP